MKKLALLLSFVMVFTLVACGSKKEDAESEIIESDVIDDGQLAGGWTVYDGDLNSALTSEEAEIFEAALEGYTGKGFEPVAVIAKQVVAGTNYQFLTRSTLMTSEMTLSWDIVTVYQDLEGNAEILNVAPLDYVDTVSSADPEMITGGWTVNNDCTIELPTAKEVIEKAFTDLDGCSYNPYAVLATQVVAGTNYKVFCIATPVVPDAQSSLCIVTIYEDLDGNTEIIDTAILDPAQFNE